MAIKLSGSISRKIPIDSIPYSSQSFSAGMEVEVADASTILAQLTQLYASLNQGIDAQIAAATAQQPALPPAPPVHSVNGNGQVHAPLPAPAPQPVQQRTTFVNRVAANGNGNGRAVGSTVSQQKAIWAICKSLNVSLPDALSQYGVADAKLLTVKQASELIDSLKSQQNGVQ